MPVGQDDTSEFNMGLAYLETLRFILNSADRAAMSLNPHGWFHCLIALRRELSDDMKPEQLVQSNNYMSIISKYLPAFSTSQARGVRNMAPELYMKLDEFEIFLRRIMKAKGYKTRYQESPGLSLT